MAAHEYVRPDPSEPAENDMEECTCGLRRPVGGVVLRLRGWSSLCPHLEAGYCWSPPRSPLYTITAFWCRREEGSFRVKPEVHPSEVSSAGDIDNRTHDRPAQDQMNCESQVPITSSTRFFVLRALKSTQTSYYPSRDDERATVPWPKL